MYSDTVTVFCYYESSDEAIWYPYVLSGVDLNMDRGAILKKYGPGSTDNTQLHIEYQEQDGSKLIRTAAGFFLPWLPPKSWKRQEAGERAASITFGNDDFFIAGEWEAGAVNDADYPDGFYQYLNAERDYCFKISSVGGPYSLIPHFEILGK